MELPPIAQPLGTMRRAGHVITGIGRERICDVEVGVSVLAVKVETVLWQIGNKSCLFIQTVGPGVGHLGSDMVPVRGSDQRL